MRLETTDACFTLIVGVDGARAGQTLDPRGEPDQLAKEWLLRLIDRTPLEQVADLPVSWIVSEAPPLIAEIIEALAEPAGATERELSSQERSRADVLAKLRAGPGAAEQIPRDLAVLQGLLVESIRRDIPERNPGDFSRAVQRLAEVFGSINAQVSSSLVEERSGGAPADPLTGMAGPAALEEWLRILLAGQRRYDRGFVVCLVEIDGLELVDRAYGEDAAARMVSAVASVIKSEVKEPDQAFRRDADEFAILAMQPEASVMVPLAERIATLIAASQSTDGPRIAIAAGIAACPADADSIDGLLERAAEAVYSAKAAGRPVGAIANGTGVALQDP